MVLICIFVPMADKYSRRRVASSSVTTVISLSLVLFLLGLLGLLVLSAEKVSEHIKENIGFQIYLKDEAKEVDISRLQKSLDARPYVKSTEYISKEKALEIYKSELGEDFMPLTGYNPLPASIDLRLKADYANNDSIAWIKNEVLADKIVQEFDYRENLVFKINNNVKTISFYFGIFIALLMVIAVALINNTIRLAIYSKRFLIRTMQLVGATRLFISRPFILSGILQGIFGGLLAIVLLIGFVYLSLREIPDLLNVIDGTLFLSLFGLVILTGMIISGLSTSLAVRKYLKSNTEDLYK